MDEGRLLVTPMGQYPPIPDDKGQSAINEESKGRMALNSMDESSLHNRLLRINIDSAKLSCTHDRGANAGKMLLNMHEQNWRKPGYPSNQPTLMKPRQQAPPFSDIDKAFINRQRMSNSRNLIQLVRQAEASMMKEQTPAFSHHKNNQSASQYQKQQYSNQQDSDSEMTLYGTFISRADSGGQLEQATGLNEQRGYILSAG